LPGESRGYISSGNRPTKKKKNHATKQAIATTQQCASKKAKKTRISPKSLKKKA